MRSLPFSVPFVALLLTSACSGGEAPAFRAAAPGCPPRMVEIPGLRACIDRHEAYVARGRAEPATTELPENEISYQDAQRACEASSFRLCTGTEWGQACGGADTARVHPYGDEHEPHRCNLAEDDEDLSTLHVAPSGQFSRCVTPEGVFDLAGNVAEWTNEPDGSGTLRELRGGAARNPERYARCQIGDRGFQPVDQAWRGQGFRCCASLRR